MLNVFFTVDVEIWCNGWEDINRKFPHSPETRGQTSCMKNWMPSWLAGQSIDPMNITRGSEEGASQPKYSESTSVGMTETLSRPSRFRNYAASFSDTAIPASNRFKVSASNRVIFTANLRLHPEGTKIGEVL
jgi:hypothetical protein